MSFIYVSTNYQFYFPPLLFGVAMSGSRVISGNTMAGAQLPIRAHCLHKLLYEVTIRYNRTWGPRTQIFTCTLPKNQDKTSM